MFRDKTLIPTEAIRVLALGLRPVLPGISAAASRFLNSDDADWQSAAKPLLSHRIADYQALLTREIEAENARLVGLEKLRELAGVPVASVAPL